MRDVQRIAIVDPADATREPLRNMLLGVESVWLEAECSRYEFFLDADHAKALQLIAQLTQESPGIPILAVSGRGDGQSILQALRSGAKEFLTSPVVLEELLTALQRLQRTRAGGEGSGQHRALGESLVIAVAGARGGVGSTSLAVNIGCSLAQNPSNSVAL